MMEQQFRAAAGAASRGGRLRVLLAGVLVAAALAYLVWASLPQGTVYYRTVAEVLAAGSGAGAVRVAGAVAPGSIRRGGAAPLQFEIADGAARLPVRYGGVVPDIFGPEIEVVVEGQRDAAGVFSAETLLTKCPSRFDSAAALGGAAQ